MAGTTHPPPPRTGEGRRASSRGQEALDRARFAGQRIGGTGLQGFDEVPGARDLPIETGADVELQDIGDIPILLGVLALQGLGGDDETGLHQLQLATELRELVADAGGVDCGVTMMSIIARRCPCFRGKSTGLG